MTNQDKLRTIKIKILQSLILCNAICKNVVTNISFAGGCNGNLKVIPLLVDGWTVEDIEKTLSGVICGRRPISCADQHARACRAAYEEQNEEEQA